MRLIKPSGVAGRAGSYAVTVSVNDPVEADLVIVIAPADAPPAEGDDPRAAPDAADLPTTGSSPGMPIGLAVLSVLTGLALVLLTTRSLGRGRRLQG